MLHGILDILPGPGARVLDIGAGTGRHAAWLAARGCDVTAVDPVPELRSAQGLRWVTDHLPALALVRGTYDMLLICAVWHHLSPTQRAAAWPRLAALRAPGAALALSLRNGLAAEGRPAWPVDPSAEAGAARRHGFDVLFQRPQAPVQAANRAAGVTWTWLALKHSARARAKA